MQVVGVGVDLLDLQASGIEQCVPLLLSSLHSGHDGHYHHVQLGLLPINILVWKYHIVNENDRVLAHRSDREAQNFPTFRVWVIVHNVTHIVGACTCSA